MTAVLERLRTQGRERFDELGFPSRRSEMWKYTDVGSIARGDFSKPAPGNVSQEHAEFVAEMAKAGPVIVVANGQFREDLSTGLGSVSGLGLQRASEVPDRVQALLDDGPEVGDRQFAHLNAVNMEDPIFLSIDANADIDVPLHLVFINGGNSAFHPRIFISTGSNSRVTLHEAHVGADGAAYFSNPVMHIGVGDGARLNHYRRQCDGSDAMHVATSFVAVGRDATYEAFALSLGADLARHEIEARFLGSGGDCTLSGAYVAAPNQHLDTTTRIDHRFPDCRSREVYHGAIGNKGRGVFQGSIYVHPVAQRTDGHQLNRAVLLGAGAEIDAKPQLEIYADDVKCSHGCTAGQLDEQALFYMRSRGISANDAKMMLVNGFLAEAIEEISDQTVREIFTKHAQSALNERGLIDA